MSPPRVAFGATPHWGATLAARQSRFRGVLAMGSHSSSHMHFQNIEGN